MTIMVSTTQFYYYYQWLYLNTGKREFYMCAGIRAGMSELRILETCRNRARAIARVRCGYLDHVLYSYTLAPDT